MPSVEINFVSGKEVGANIDTQFVMYADMSESGIPGAIETSDRVYERITKENDIDFLLHIGDLSYAEGNVNTWDTWMSYIEPYSGLVPYHVSIGYVYSLLVLILLILLLFAHVCTNITLFFSHSLFSSEITSTAMKDKARTILQVLIEYGHLHGVIAAQVSVKLLQQCQQL